MDNNIQTSFIPKKPIVQDTRVSSSGISLFLVISIIIFLVSISLMLWVIFEKNTTIKSIEASKEIINKNKAAFEPGTIEAIIRLDNRINVSGQLLDKHVEVTPIFAFLESHTLKNVRFKSFQFLNLNKDIEGTRTIKIQMTGNSDNFRTIASQADEFGRIEFRNIIKEPVFSDLNPTQDGKVSFTFTANIVPDAISYVKNNQL